MRFSPASVRTVRRAWCRTCCSRPTARPSADYLQQLSGVEHGQKVHAELLVQNLVQGHRHAAAADGPGDRRAERGFELNSIWVAGFGSWGNQDGNDSAGGYDSNAYGMVARHRLQGRCGGQDRRDRWVMPRATSTSTTTTTRRDYNGWNVGLYGRYDLPQFYFQGVGSYGSYDNEVERNIDIAAVRCSVRRTVRCCIPDAGIDFATQPGLAATPGTANSDYSSDVWALYGEVGWKANLGTNFSIVPFAGINWHVRRDATPSSRAELRAPIWMSTRRQAGSLGFTARRASDRQQPALGQYHADPACADRLAA